MATPATQEVLVHKKKWTGNRVLNLVGDALCMLVVGAASLTCILPFIKIGRAHV